MNLRRAGLLSIVIYTLFRHINADSSLSIPGKNEVDTFSTELPPKFGHPIYQRWGAAVGIYLGANSSQMAIWQHDRYEIIPDAFGNRETPYIDYITKKFVPEEVELSVSLVTNDLVKEYEKESYNGLKWVFLVKDKDDKPFIEFKLKGKKKRFTPDKLSQMILRKMVKKAEAHIGQRVTLLLFVVPKYFTETQFSSLNQAGLRVGVERVAFEEDKHVAAATAYFFDRKPMQYEMLKVIVFEFSWNSFQVSLLSRSAGSYFLYNQATSIGSPTIWGQTMDQSILTYIAKEINQKLNKDISTNPRAIKLVHESVEKAKKELLTRHQTSIQIDSLFQGINFSTILTRARFERLNKHLFDEALEHVKKVLKEGQIRKERIDEIILVGEYTKTPKIQEILSNLFNKKFNNFLNPNNLFAFGAAMAAVNLPPRKMLDFMCYIPTARLSMGIATAGGLMARVLPRNTILPTKKSQLFTTSEDYQTSALIRVYQGERALVKDNVFVGEYQLTGIPPAPRGVSLIDIHIILDDDNYLRVIAVEKDSGHFITVHTHSFNDKPLTSEEILLQIKEAEQYQKEDEEIRDQIKAQVSLDFYAHYLRNILQIERIYENIKIPETQRLQFLEEVNNIILWYEENPEAYTEEYEAQYRDLEEIAASLGLEKNYDYTDFLLVDHDPDTQDIVYAK
ncbi:hypothetical protein G9A89_015266 [Geosiphon pyriformis]|nr:hypothetical protein G9A89_015266 [Geosiphon pyriformis]